MLQDTPEPSDEDIEADGHGAGEDFLFGFSFVSLPFMTFR